MQEPQRDRDELSEGAAERPGGERTSLDREPPPAEDPLVRRQEAVAAAEAGSIGGPAPAGAADDEATRPVVEAGGGEAEGFEEAERELAEHAAHGEDRLSPEADAFTPEVEADESTAAYGEPDEVDPTEVVRDPEEGPDDPGAGPGVAPDR